MKKYRRLTEPQAPIQSSLRSWAYALASTTLACGAPGAPGAPDSNTDPSEVEQRVISGDDDRREYYELEEARWRELMKRSAVALMGPAEVDLALSGNLNGATTSGQADDLCAGEPFAAQPALAFCSGVLVDWDLVLTAGHCVGDLAVDDLRVVFGFYYSAKGRLALSREGVFRVRQVLAIRADSSQSSLSRLDYAWLRLAEVVRPPLRPAPIYASAPALNAEQSVFTIGAPGGVPLKLDAGGRVRDVRSRISDYFVADTDTSDGWSGGAAFDASFAVLGILMGGAQDYESTPAGCRISTRTSDASEAREEFTYAHQAVAGLCREDTSYLCYANCSEVCVPPERPNGASLEGGLDCSVYSRRLHGRPGLEFLWLVFSLAWVVGLTRRKRRRASSVVGRKVYDPRIRVLVCATCNPNLFPELKIP